jgi:hypothetical protein
MRLQNVLPALVAASLFAMCAANAIAEQWQQVYPTGNDLDWVISDPAKIHCGSGTVDGVQVNTEGTYAYIPIPDFDPNKTWKLAYDLRINSCDWSAGVTFGLFDNTLKYPHGAIADQFITDGGAGISLLSETTNNWTYSPSWSQGSWYKGSMTYDAPTSTLSLTLSDRDSGAELWHLSSPIQPFPSDVKNLGVSRLHMKDTGSGASGSATCDYNLDNITLSQAVPEPSTIALLLTATIGGLLWWRRCS